MSCNKCFNATCACIGVLVSVIIGAIVGVLYAFNNIPFITTAAWIAFGLGAFSLIVLIAGVYLSAVTAAYALSKCLCKNITFLLISIIGTIVLSLIILVAPLNILFLSNILLVAFAGLFLSLLIVSLVCFIICIVQKLCCVPYNG